MPAGSGGVELTDGDLTLADLTAHLDERGVSKEWWPEHLTVLDALPEPIAVFSQMGTLTLSNAAYADLWGVDPRTTIGQISIVDSMRHWLSGTEPTPIWGEARDFVGAIGDRSEWVGDVRMKDGRPVHCRFIPITGGNTMIRFFVGSAGTRRAFDPFDLNGIETRV